MSSKRNWGRGISRRLGIAANCLDNLARFSADSTLLNGFESGGGHFPRWVLRPFRTRNPKKESQRGKGKSYDCQTSCAPVCNRACHGVRCASSIAHPKRIVHRIALTGGESCIALTRGVANCFAQSKTYSQEREG